MVEVNTTTPLTHQGLEAFGGQLLADLLQDYYATESYRSVMGEGKSLGIYKYYSYYAYEVEAVVTVRS